MFVVVLKTYTRDTKGSNPFIPRACFDLYDTGINNTYVYTVHNVVSDQKSKVTSERDPTNG